MLLAPNLVKTIEDVEVTYGFIVPAFLSIGALD